MKLSIIDNIPLFPKYKMVNHNGYTEIGSKVRVYRNIGSGKVIQVFLLQVIDRFADVESANLPNIIERHLSTCTKNISFYKIPDITTKEITENEMLGLEYVGEDTLDNFIKL